MRNFKKIYANEIKEFYVTDDTALYRAVHINNSKSKGYLAYAEKGRINLYYRVVTNTATYNAFSNYSNNGFHTTSGYGNSVEWFAGKDSDDYVRDFYPVFLSANKTKKQMKDEFALWLKDNPRVLDKFINDDKFSFDDIQKIVHLYNTGEVYDGEYNGTQRISGRNYIVTPKNDTVYCRIRNDYFTGKYMFQPSKNDDFTAIDTLNTREFFYARDTSHFAPVHAPGLPGRVFLKQVEKGRVNLYQQKIVSDDRDKKEIKSLWYINKANGPLLLIASRANRLRKFELQYRHINDFFNAIGDNPGLLVSSKKAFNKPDVNTEELIRYYIKSYNLTYLSNSETGKQ